MPEFIASPSARQHLASPGFQAVESQLICTRQQHIDTTGLPKYTVAPAGSLGSRVAVLAAVLRMIATNRHLV